MNYLAHIFLSCSNEELMVGNFMADFCRNKDLEKLSPELMEGINLHKAIDSFTDSHPMWLRSTERFYKRHGKYASVLTDMIYDVFLIRNWARYSGEELGAFTANIYTILPKYKTSMPSKLLSKIDRMIADDFLMKYTTRQGLQESLNYMDRRTKFPSRFTDALLDLDEYEEQLNDEFNAFFPELIAMVDSKCEC